MTALILLAVAVLLIALLTLAESAVTSSRAARLEPVARAGSRRARRALRLVESPQRLLASVRLGVVGLLLAAGAVAQVGLAGPLEDLMVKYGAGEFWAGPVAMVLAIVVVALLVLLLGDLLPRRLASLSPEPVAGLLARPLRYFIAVLAPVAGLLDTLARLLVGLGGGHAPSEEPAVTDEDIKDLIDEGTRTGVLEKAEHDIVTNVFRLGDRRASSLMTPRTEIDWIDVAASQEDIRRIMSEHPHSHYPIATGSLDNVAGILVSKECLARAFAGEPIVLDELMRPPLVIPESVSALQLLESFRENPEQVALIADEYGSVIGMVSQDDLLESIVGDLPSPSSMSEEPNATRREDGSWLVDASMPADELKDLLELDELPGEAEFDTVGGFVLMQLQRIPKAADSFSWGDWRVEVVDMDGKRIDKVLVQPVSERHSRDDESS